jgi:hypothetical protein
MVRWLELRNYWFHQILRRFNKRHKTPYTYLTDVSPVVGVRVTNKNVNTCDVNVYKRRCAVHWLRPSVPGVAGLTPSLGMNVYVSMFCDGRALSIVLSVIKEVLPPVLIDYTNIYNEGGQSSTRTVRLVDRCDVLWGYLPHEHEVSTIVQ